MTTADVPARPPSEAPLIEARGLVKEYKTHGVLLRGGRKQVSAVVDDVSFHVKRRETLGLVGESGCGKSTVAKMLLNLTPVTSGDVLFDGKSILRRRGQSLRDFRRNCQIVFQDPIGALDPRQRVGQAIAEVLRVHQLVPDGHTGDRIAELFHQVNLPPELMRAYPRALSGGQRQRVVIARALAVEPKFIVADEATSALDVSVQAQIVNLMLDLQDQLGLSYLFISHGLAVVQKMSDRIAVMFLGRIVELASTEEILRSPAHHYTGALLAAAPVPNPDDRRALGKLESVARDAGAVSGGCRFRARCPAAVDKCAEVDPALREISPGHWVACHFPRGASTGL